MFPPGSIVEQALDTPGRPEKNEIVNSLPSMLSIQPGKPCSLEPRRYAVAAVRSADELVGIGPDPNVGAAATAGGGAAGLVEQQFISDGQIAQGNLLLRLSRRAVSSSTVNSP